MSGNAGHIPQGITVEGHNHKRIMGNFIPWLLRGGGLAETLFHSPHLLVGRRSRGEKRQEKASNPGHRARRWVVEACHSWMNRFRKILVWFAKTDRNYFALVHLACAIISWRKVGTIGISPKSP